MVVNSRERWYTFVSQPVAYTFSSGKSWSLGIYALRANRKMRTAAVPVFSSLLPTYTNKKVII